MMHVTLSESQKNEPIESQADTFNRWKRYLMKNLKYRNVTLKT